VVDTPAPVAFHVKQRADETRPGLAETTRFHVKPAWTTAPWSPTELVPRETAIDKRENRVFHAIPGVVSGRERVRPVACGTTR
jgi:hypothetical protein